METLNPPTQRLLSTGTLHAADAPGSDIDRPLQWLGVQRHRLKGGFFFGAAELRLQTTEQSLIRMGTKRSVWTQHGVLNQNSWVMLQIVSQLSSPMIIAPRSKKSPGLLSSPSLRAKFVALFLESSSHSWDKTVTRHPAAEHFRTDPPRLLACCRVSVAGVPCPAPPSGHRVKDPDGWPTGRRTRSGRAFVGKPPARSMDQNQRHRHVRRNWGLLVPEDVCVFGFFRHGGHGGCRDQWM